LLQPTTFREDPMNAIVEKFKLQPKWIKVSAFVAAGLLAYPLFKLAPPFSSEGLAQKSYSKIVQSAQVLEEAQRSLTDLSAVQGKELLASHRDKRDNGAAPAALASQALSGAPTSADDGRMIIRNANLELEVESVAAAYAAVMNILATQEAELRNGNLQTPENGPRHAWLTLAVSPDRLPRLLRGVSAIGLEKSVQINTSDITGTYVDHESRLRNALHVRQHLYQLLETRTGRLSDVMEVEREISRVSEQIEVMQGQIRSMKAQVEKAVLQIHLFEKPDQIVTEENSFLGDVAGMFERAFKQATTLFVNTVAALMTLLGFLAGVAVYAGLAAAVYFLGKALKKKYS
jgi:hypothetical protein